MPDAFSFLCLAASALVFDDHDHAGETNEDRPDDVYCIFCEKALVLKQEADCEKDDQDRDDAVMIVITRLIFFHI